MKKLTYVVVGRHKQTGAGMKIVLQALSEKDARTQAIDKEIDIEYVEACDSDFDTLGRDEVTSTQEINVGDVPTLPPASRGELETLLPNPATRETLAAGTKIRYFGDYELLTEIARGGMGVVYRARQNKLNRIVAIKMILAGQFASQEDVQRFYTEAEAAAKLDHPGIVPIFEVGQYQGQHFFSMGFVEGESLADRLRNGPLPPKESAELMQQISDAIAYAHLHGVIHRDLKPANVLLDVHGNPKVSDFGLAKNLESESGLTRTGSVMGTPSYMPPEQAGGDTAQVGPHSDIYSLGAMLYCCVTGRPPFQSANPLDTLRQVVSSEPISPRQLNPQVPRDLETICLKCLQKEALRRYESAEALAADLRRFLRAAPIHARSISHSERTWRWCKRNPLVSSLLAVSVSLLIVSLWTLRGESQQRAIAETQRKVADTQTVKAQAAQAKAIQQEQLAKLAFVDLAEQAKQASRGLFDYSTIEYLAGHHASSVDKLDRAVKLRGDDDPLKKLYGNVLADRISHGGRLLTKIHHDDNIRTIIFSPDGKRVATASHDKTAKLWNADTGAIIGEPMRHGQLVVDVAFSPDGTRLATASHDKTARLWDALTGSPLGMPMRHDASVNTVIFSPDGTRVVTASADKTARLWNAETCMPLCDPMRHDGEVTSVAFSPDGSRLATASKDGTARCWDGQSGISVGVTLRHDLAIRSVVFSPDGTRIATASDDKTARLWDAVNGVPLGQPLRHEGNVFSVAFSPDGARMATSSADDTARLWDALTCLPLGEPMRHSDTVVQVAFSSDGMQLATASWDSTACLWDAQTGELLSEPMRCDRNLNSVCFSPDGSCIATASLDGTACVWTQAGVLPCDPYRLKGKASSVSFSPDGKILAAASRGRLWQLWDTQVDTSVALSKGKGGAGRVVAFSPDGARFATGSWDKTVQLWDAKSGTPLSEPIRHDDLVTCVTFSSDGTRLATASKDMTVRFWDAQTGAALADTIRHTSPVLSVAFSPDGTRIATATFNRAAHLWDSRTGKSLGRIKHDDIVRSVAFTPDGTRLATGSWDQAVLFWDASTGDPIGNPMPHKERVNFIAFSPDGTLFATASPDKTARIWDTETGAPTGEPMRHDDAVNSVAFSPDGTRLATASDDTTIRLWDIERMVPKNPMTYVNRFIKEPVPTIIPDPDFQSDLEAFQAKRTMRHREAMATKAVAGKNWFAATFHLPWLIEHQPNVLRWKTMLDLVPAESVKSAATKIDQFEKPEAPFAFPSVDSSPDNSR